MRTIQKRKPNSSLATDLISEYPAVDGPFQRPGQNRCYQQHRKSELAAHLLEATHRGLIKRLLHCVRASFRTRPTQNLGAHLALPILPTGGNAQPALGYSASLEEPKPGRTGR